MISLLADALDAHGGLSNWNKWRNVSADVISGGELLDRKAPDTSDQRRATASIHEQRLEATAVATPGRKLVFQPERVIVESGTGEVLAERGNPRESFAGHTLETPWDGMHRGYFSGYALWSYLTAPFSFALPGVQAFEIDPLEENGELWRGLRVIMPDNYATHSRAQDFYFGSDMLLRRQDYTLDVADGSKIANYALDIVEEEGIRLPSRRRAYMCNKKYEVQYDRMFMR